jgi:monoamine oxidase
MKSTDVIIIGAGAAGLMAAYILVKAGTTVTVLEARSRLGGRIHSLNKEQSFTHAEVGAEFVHGNLPITLGLLKEAGIGTTGVTFEMWQHHNGTFKQSEEFVEGWDAFLEKLNQLQEDMPLDDFLQQNFAGEEHAKMRSQIENYVAGYDTADVKDASAFSLRNEWNHEDEDAQHRVKGGYSAMIDYLADSCRNAGNNIQLNAVVNKIDWQANKVSATTVDGVVYEAQRIIIALPLGVLKAQNGAKGAIQFNPPLEEQTIAINSMGFGSVIKILLEFDDIFWEGDAVTRLAGADLSTMGFLFADEDIPTFWTQSPAHTPLLTGWLGGPAAAAMKETSDEDILQLTLSSLGHIFKMDINTIKDKLVAWHVANWASMPFTRGSYAYDTVASPQARKILQHPVQNTVYFAGEYLYDGAAMGTVEAALTSGKNTAQKLLK